jgi:hypothetical protein
MSSVVLLDSVSTHLTSFCILGVKICMSVENTQNNDILQQPGSGELEGGSEALFVQATRWATLWRAWERVRANNGAAGGDGVSVARMS